MPNMKSRLLLTVIATPVKVKNRRETDKRTERQTGQKHYARADHSIRGHKNNTCNKNKNKSLDYTTITYRLRTVMQLERHNSHSTGVVYTSSVA